MLYDPQESLGHSYHDQFYPQETAFDHSIGYLGQDTYTISVNPPQTLQEDFSPQGYSPIDVFQDDDSLLDSVDMFEHQDAQYHHDGHNQSWRPVNSEYYDQPFMSGPPHAPEPMQKTISHCSTEQTLETVSSHSSKDSGYMSIASAPSPCSPHSASKSHRRSRSPKHASRHPKITKHSPSTDRISKSPRLGTSPETDNPTLWCYNPACVDPVTGLSTRRYSRKADVDRHRKSAHDPVYHECRYNCDRKGSNAFTRKDHLIEHYRSKHGKDIPKGRTVSHGAKGKGQGGRCKIESEGVKEEILTY